MANLLGDFISWLTGVDVDQGRGAGLTVSLKGEDVALPVVYGQRRVSPIRVYAETRDIASGLPNELIYMAMPLCHGEVDSVGEMHVNGEPLAESKFNNTRNREWLILDEVYTGTDTQTADSTFTSETQDWTSDHRGRGVAYAALKMAMPDWGEKNPFLGGMPEFSWLVRGQKVYDPRKDSTQTSISGSGSHRTNDKTTWEWSDNPALCIMDYLTNSRYGKGLDYALIDIDSFAAAADDFETSQAVETGVTTSQGVPAAASSYTNGGAVDHYYVDFAGDVTESFRPGRQITQNSVEFTTRFAKLDKTSSVTRVVYDITDSTPTQMDAVNAVTVSTFDGQFTTNAIIDTDQQIIDNIKQLLAGCRAYMPYYDGKYHLYLENTSTSQMSFDTSNMIGGISISLPKKDKRFNQVRATFPDPKNDYKKSEIVWPEVGSAEESLFLVEDSNEPLVKEVHFDTIASEYQAQNMAKAVCLHSRYGTRVSFKAFPEAAKLAVNDVIDIIHPTPGWSSEGEDWGLVTDSVTESEDWGLVTDAAATFDDWGFVDEGDGTGVHFIIEALKLNYDGTVEIDARQYIGSVYDYDATQAKANKVRTDLPDAYEVTAPTGLTLSDDSVQLGDGTLNPVLGVAWTASTDRFVRDYEIQWKKDSDSVYRSIFTPNTNAALVVEAIDTYDVRVRALNGIGSVSDWITGSQLVDDDTTAPSAPTIGSVTKTKLGLRLEWTNASDVDVSKAEIHIRSTNSSSTATTYRIDTIAATPGDPGVYYINTDRVAAGSTWYAWVINQDYAGNRGAASGTVALPQVVDAASSLTLTETTSQDSAGNTISAVEVSWNAPADTDNVAEYIVRWKKSTDSDYQTLRTDQTTALVEGVVIGKTYNFGVFAISEGGVKSTEITGSKALVGDTTAPSAPASVTATSAPFAIKLSWTNPSDADLDAVEVHVRAANTTPTDDTYLEETVKAIAGKDQTFRLPAGDFDLDTTYYIFLRALDYTGNESSFTSSVNAQFSKADTAQIQDGAIETAQIASNAVGTSQIANNAVDTNQIATDAVETVKILDEAVSTGISSYTAGTIAYGPGTGGVGTNIQSVTITSTGAPIEILFACLVEGLNSNGQGVVFQVYRDTTNLYQTDNIYVPGTNNVPFSGAISDSPAAGTYTYHLKASRTFGSTLNQQAQNRFLRCLELKK